MAEERFAAYSNQHKAGKTSRDSVDLQLMEEDGSSQPCSIACSLVNHAKHKLIEVESSCSHRGVVDSSLLRGAYFLQPCSQQRLCSTRLV